MKKKSMILSAVLAASLLCFGGNADVSASSAHHDEAEHVHAPMPPHPSTAAGR